MAKKLLSLMSHHHDPYGVGLAYRFPVHHEVIRHRDEIDLLEISTEDYIVRERRMFSDPNEQLLRDALATFPCVAHGLRLSIGTVAEPNQTYLGDTRRFIEEHGLNIFSEHLAFHSVDGHDLTMFLAMPFEEVSIQWLKQNYYAVRRAVGRPFALENVTYHFPIPQSSLSEADFLRRLTEETDCTLLLDVTNVFNNSHNHGYDPMEFFDRLPMERVSQMHLAGGHQLPNGKWEDSHSSPVMEPVWPIFEEAVKRATNARIVILERDSKLDPFDSVMHDIRRAREIFYRHKPSTPPVRESDFSTKPEVAHTPDAIEFSQLRGFQRAMMARITDADFRSEFQKNPTTACARVGLTDPAWVGRLSQCDRDCMHYFHESWEIFQKEDQEIAAEYKDREWSAWADQLQQG
jgi:hypothetical protein